MGINLSYKCHFYRPGAYSGKYGKPIYVIIHVGSIKPVLFSSVANRASLINFSVAIGVEFLFLFPQDLYADPYGDSHRGNLFPISMGMGIPMGIPIPMATLKVIIRELSRSARRSFWSMILGKKIIRSAKNWNLPYTVTLICDLGV